jgi:diguanylate cyclase (GGDEF)-like protein
VRVLIADDDAVSRRMLEAALRRMGHDVVVTCNGQEAWERIRRDDIRIVVADWMMPEMDGLELVRQIRSLVDQGYIYAILLTSRSQRQDIIHGLAAGADDYITKPFDRDELMVRIRAGERVVRLESDLASRNEQLRRLTLIDELTGLGNRRAFDSTLSRLYDHSRRYRRVLGFVMIDIDRFKLYNDSLGHKAGDTALEKVARLIRENTRSADLAFRYGGEEFACLLPETDEVGSVTVAERLRCAVAGAGLPHPSNPPHLITTVSCGVATLEPGNSMTQDELVRRADEALYAAKRGGRDRVELAEGHSAPVVLHGEGAEDAGARG